MAGRHRTIPDWMARRPVRGVSSPRLGGLGVCSIRLRGLIDLQAEQHQRHGQVPLM